MNEAIINQVEEFLRLCADRAAGREFYPHTEAIRKWKLQNSGADKERPTEVLGRLLLQLPIGTTFTIKG